MDIQMPDTNGIEATRQILAASPHLGIVVLTISQAFPELTDREQRPLSSTRAHGMRPYAIVVAVG